MRMSIKLILALLTIFTFANCNKAMVVRNTKKPTGIVRVSQFTGEGTDGSTLIWAHHDPTQRQTLMHIDTDGNVKVLAEQSPDAGVSSMTDIIGKIKIIKEIDLEAILKIESQLEKLTNRTSSLMITREYLYALREFHYNGAINSAEIITLNKQYLDKLVDIVKEDSKIEEAKAKTLQLQLDLEKVLLEKLKIESKKDTTSNKNSSKNEK